MKRVQSTCNFCALDCNIDFYVEDNKIVKVVPTKGYPVNDGFSCIKGLSLDKQQTVVKGSKLPKVRQKDGSFKTMEWNDTFKYVADKFIEIKEKYGSESIAGISTGQLTLEEFALLGHVMRNHLKANLDGNTRLCMATAVVAHKQSYGFDSPPYTLNDVELSDTVILIGANPVVAHPILWDRIRSNKNKKLIVIDPRKSETAMNSDIWIDLKPKSDLYLIYAIANVLIENNWIDEEFIRNHTEDFEGFKEHIKKYDINDVEEYTGISKGRVKELAEIIHKGKNVSFWWTMGVNQGYQAVRTAQGIINLALMTGNIGRPGTGANSITGQCNAMGSRAFSNTTGLYGGGEYTDEKRRKAVAEALDIDEDMLPTKPTLPYNVIVDKILSGEIKALWIVATNPIVSWINDYEFKKAAEKLEFLVVQDIYSDTETAKYCDLFLPSTNGLKKEGVIINTERRLSKLDPVLPKMENELSDYDIALGIGKALGMGKLLDKWKTPEIAFNTIKQCTKGTPCDITGVTYEDLKESRGIQWPFREGEKLEEDERRLFEDKHFYTASGKAKFIYEDIEEVKYKQNEEYPYLLNTGRATVGQWHTLTRTREIQDVYAISVKEGYVNMNPDLAEELGINENEKIKIVSPNGVINYFIVKFSRTVKKDHLFAPMHYVEANSVLPSIFDKYSKEPSFKYVPVNIEKVY